MNLEHGGNRVAAEAQFGIPVNRWIDISTGISPWSWPVPALPESVFRELPYSDGGLELAAWQCYGVQPQSVLVVPGSQYALQVLPTLIPKGTVAMPLAGYAEHRKAWLEAGHTLVDYADVASLEALVGDSDAVTDIHYAVLINPNNPTTEICSRAQVDSLHCTLLSRGGFLLVDEAFVDCQPSISSAASCSSNGLVVLRSLGKFYGLAGVRLGFVLGPSVLLEKIADTMSPWLVSHPARWIGEHALLDTAWQQEQTERLLAYSEEWHAQLSEILPQMSWVRNPLFMTVLTQPEQASRLHASMGRQGILIRKFGAVKDAPGPQPLIRVGLPHPDDRERVLMALNVASKEME